jgi:hypothetical protein
MIALPLAYMQKFSKNYFSAQNGQKFPQIHKKYAKFEKKN